MYFGRFRAGRDGDSIEEKSRDATLLDDGDRAARTAGAADNLTANLQEGRGPISSEKHPAFTAAIVPGRRAE
ncbi:MAG: hypothetical protein H0W18_09605, partial [Acidobacteria bacterium]|nr:hypothetical protein [Acidobacteriota bacterium]